jgi:hypothetical protein
MRAFGLASGSRDRVRAELNARRAVSAVLRCMKLTRTKVLRAVIWTVRDHGNGYRSFWNNSSLGAPLSDWRNGFPPELSTPRTRVSSFRYAGCLAAFRHSERSDLAPCRSLATARANARLTLAEGPSVPITAGRTIDEPISLGDRIIEWVGVGVSILMFASQVWCAIAPLIGR